MPTQPSLRRMREHDVRPRRDLGQNFLVDSNILGVIERLAGLEPQDVVLERRDRATPAERVRRDPQLLVDLLCSPLNGAVQPPTVADSGASSG